MAKIIVRNSDNLAVFCLEDSQDITLTANECKFTNANGTNTYVQDINSGTHSVYTDVTAPTKFWGNCFTYIDGNWALDNDRVTNVNAGRTANDLPEIEVEL